MMVCDGMECVQHLFRGPIPTVTAANLRSSKRGLRAGVFEVREYGVRCRYHSIFIASLEEENALLGQNLAKDREVGSDDRSPVGQGFNRRQAKTFKRGRENERLCMRVEICQRLVIDRAHKEYARYAAFIDSFFDACEKHVVGTRDHKREIGVRFGNDRPGIYQEIESLVRIGRTDIKQIAGGW